MKHSNYSMQDTAKNSQGRDAAMPPVFNPAKVLALVVATVAVCESMALFIRGTFSPGYFVTVLSDVGLLILFLTPALYVFLFRPLVAWREASRRVAGSLAESEARHQSIFQTANDAIIVITGPDGRIDMWNQKAEAMFGYAIDEAAGKDLHELIVPDRYRQKARGEMKKFFETGEGAVINKTLEIFALRRDGSEFPIELSISRIKTTTGWKAVGIIRDIEARKKLEMEQIKLALAVEQSPASIVITDMDANIQYINEKFCQLTGYTKEEAIGKNPRLLKSGEQSQEFYKKLWDTILSGKNWQGEFHNKKKNGELYWENAVIAPVKNEQGEIACFIAVKEDITQKKGLISALLENQELFKLLADNSGIVFWIMSADSKKTLFVNSAYEKMWGRSCESLYKNGESWLLAIHPDDKEAATQAWMSTVVTGKHYAVDYRIVWPNGEIRWIHDEGGPIHNDKGEVYRLAGVAEDITERKRLEENLERNREQLLASQKLASIGQLADGACHEILNPLNIIALQAQMLSRQRSEDANLLACMEKVNQQVRRVKKIIDALLMFSEREAKGSEQVRIETVLDLVLTLVEKDFKPDNIKIVRDFEPGLPEIRAQTEELKQVFLNIASNAKDAMPRGGTLTVRARKIRKNGDDFIRVTFSDTGVGIKRENLKNIFNPFFSAKPEGMGMGLAICHTFIAKNGGTITVESEEGKGATFIIDLPPPAFSRVARHGKRPLVNEFGQVAVKFQNVILRRAHSTSLRAGSATKNLGGGPDPSLALRMTKKTQDDAAKMFFFSNPSAPLLA